MHGFPRSRAFYCHREVKIDFLRRIHSKDRSKYTKQTQSAECKHWFECQMLIEW